MKKEVSEVFEKEQSNESCIHWKNAVGVLTKFQLIY